MKSYAETSEHKQVLHVPLWRNMNYLLLVGGQGISALGTFSSDFVIPLLTLSLTGSVVQAGLIVALRSLIMNLLSLPAGALADRWPRKPLMAISEGANALVCASILLTWWLGGFSIIQLYGVAIVQGVLFMFYQAAESAALRHTVACEQLPVAAGQGEVINSISLTVGPLFGGFLYACGHFWPFAVDACSFALSAFSLLLIHVDFQDEAGVDQQPAQHMWLDICEGLLWVWRTPLVRLLGLMTTGLLVPCAGYSLLMIALAQQMHADSVATGYIFAAGGLGSLLGALVSAPLQKLLGFKRLIILSAWIWGLLWLVYLLAPNPPVLAALNCLGYAIVPIFMVTAYSYRIAITPDGLQGRVNSVFRLLSRGGVPLGIALTGVMLQYLGTTSTILITFIPQLIVALMATGSKVLHHSLTIDEA